MRSAKDIIVKPISSADAERVVKRFHYSGKVVQNSQLHFGVFIDGRCEGAMQFGPSMDKRKLIGLVEGTAWNDFIELNRMAFGPKLPRNSESRAISIALRMIRKHYPNIGWVISFADGTQCGDGTIYRASGFVLTGWTKNKTLIEFPDGTRIANMTLTANWDAESVAALCRRLGVPVKYRTVKEWRNLGGRELEGFQFRYIYFLDPKARERLTVPILPFSKIDELGARMYRGERGKRAGSSDSAAPEYHSGEGGAVPTPALQPSGGGDPCRS